MWKLISLEALCGSIYYKNWPPQRVSKLTFRALTFRDIYLRSPSLMAEERSLLIFRQEQLVTNKDVTKRGGGFT